MNGCTQAWVLGFRPGGIEDGYCPVLRSATAVRISDNRPKVSGSFCKNPCACHHDGYGAGTSPNLRILPISTADPTDIFEASPTELGIAWRDGHRSVYPFDHLRAQCPCATCNDLRNKSGPIPVNAKTIRITEIRPVGRYALNIFWNDAHSTGIYAWEFLRMICPCAECRKSG